MYIYAQSDLSWSLGIFAEKMIIIDKDLAVRMNTEPGFRESEKVKWGRPIK
jgi:hypothetical protein